MKLSEGLRQIGLGQGSWLSRQGQDQGRWKIAWRLHWDMTMPRRIHDTSLVVTTVPYCDEAVVWGTRVCVTRHLLYCNLQQCTGVDDLETCMAILEHHDWNLQVIVWSCVWSLFFLAWICKVLPSDKETISVTRINSSWPSLRR